MKNNMLRRILAWVLTVAILMSNLPAAFAAPRLTLLETDREIQLQQERVQQMESADQEFLRSTDPVRVSIVLEELPTIQAGYSTASIAGNSRAMSYNQALRTAQQTMAQNISTQVLGGEPLDVVWNLTLVGNLISANVPYGKLDQIRALEGVREVVIERQYSQTASESLSPDGGITTEMTGAQQVWSTGNTGAGSRIAIIDTGTDTDHQSFSNDAFLYALEQNAEARGLDSRQYIESLNLLDAEEIASVMPLLNVTSKVGAEAVDYFLSEKLPFAANYVDWNLVVDHDSDDQGSHGSHVAGIAAANRFIPDGSGYADALDTVLMCGVAPDAQIITMKVFGNAEGPYDSDYFAAIEDAIYLGCDSVNLSLGTSSPGFSYNDTYEELLAYLQTTDTVVSISAGNGGAWTDYSSTELLYPDSGSFHTGGSPGTYGSALTVASADNQGIVSNCIRVDNYKITYSEPLGFKNETLTTLDTSADGTGTEYPYIFIDGIGQASDYANLDLSGKIVFCSRGTIAFYEKGNIAASLGAAAVVICNNVAGIINMDLTDYTYTAPCVAIQLSDAEKIREISVQQTTGNTVWYSGTLTISSGMDIVDYGNEYDTMSSFSSWGVPGDLSLKPEITAPGGMIWSVNGVDTSGTAYEHMSGTSMAAPQVAGMAALMAEYIRENGLQEKTGLLTRQLTQSLLMSTAVPMIEETSGSYYSLMQQGAGLARVDLAAAAGSYIMVDGQPDGKVKVELGEDAQRQGVYEFTFTIRDISGQDTDYVLNAELFTQALAEDAEHTLFLDKSTCTLAVDAHFEAEGLRLGSASGDLSRDLNGDGAVSVEDADHLLEWLVGNVDALQGDGDVNGDGQITSYDAAVLLAGLEYTHVVSVPANGSVAVDVRLELTEQTREYLEEFYTAGAYLEAFVFAQPRTSEEGVQGSTHSIPVFGYYGSWTELGMFDVGSYQAFASGAESRTPYLYEENGYTGNSILVTDSDGNTSYLGANPVIDGAFSLPERTTISTEIIQKISTIRFSQIRNAAGLQLVIRNADTGEVYYTNEIDGQNGAYYHAASGSWQNQVYNIYPNWDPTGLTEGTRVEIVLSAAPELYRVYDEQQLDYVIDWSRVVEDGQFVSTFLVDNTDPVIRSVSLEEAQSSVLNVTAWDDQNLAAVLVLDETGTTVLSQKEVQQPDPDTSVTVQLDVSRVYSDAFLIAAVDYAGNQIVYEVVMDLDNERPRFTALDRTHLNEDGSANYIGFDADTAAKILAAAAGRKIARAAAYADGCVFEISNDNKLYVAYDDNLNRFYCLGELDPDSEWDLVGFNDLVYNPADQKLYGLFYSELNDMTVSYLCTIDMFVGGMTVLGEMPIDANSLAIDSNGNFYSSVYGSSALYTYASDVAETDTAAFVGNLGGYSTTMLNSMAWDHSTNELYWACTVGAQTYLLLVDPSDASVELVTTMGCMAVGLYIGSDIIGNTFAPTDSVTSVRIADTASLFTGHSITLEATILPWNVSDSTLVWSTSDASVASVDENGIVTGMGIGTAVITAASALDPDKSASCTVEVTTLSNELSGLVWNQNGQVWWSSFLTDGLPEYEQLSAVSPNLPLNATAMIGDTLYVSTIDTSTGLSDLYTVDQETYALTKVGGSDSICYMDMAYSPSLGYILAPYFNYIALVDPNTGEYIGAWDWADSEFNLVGISYYRTTYNSYYSAYMDYFLILDVDGNVYLDAFINSRGTLGYFNGPDYALIQDIGESVDMNYNQGFYYDGSYAYWARFNAADNMVELRAWDCDNSGNVYQMGWFPEACWPVCGLYTSAASDDTAGILAEDMSCEQLQDSELLVNLNPVSTIVAEGSLHAVSETAVPQSDAQPSEDGTKVLVTVTVPEEASNGTLDIRYDPTVLEPYAVDSVANAFAYTVEDGKMTIAFAHRSMLDAEAAVADITFRTLKGLSTQVEISFGEFNDGVLDHSEMMPVALMPKELASGNCGSNLTWTLDEAGKLVISGTGAMTTYTGKTQMPWYAYITRITEVILEEGVTSIGDYAFYGASNLRSITIPEGVVSIGAYSFKNAVALDGLELPDTLGKIGESAFYGCSALTAVTIPEGIYTIWGYTFKNCTALEQITLPQSLIKIDEAAFYGAGLTELIIPDGVNIIGQYAFKNCQELTSVTLPASLTQIREASFYGTGLVELNLPEGVTRVGPYAFKNCSRLAELSLPESLLVIDEAAFYGSALQELTIPDSVFSIGAYAFKNCTKLVHVALPEGVTTIREATFYGCIALEEAVIPDSVKKIESYAFRKCAALASVTFGSGLTTIGESSFYGCSSLSELAIPDSVVAIQSYAFKGCTNLNSVVLGSNIATIGDSAFHSCTGLSALTFPASVESIGEYCFSGSYNLWLLTFEGDAPVIGAYAFKGLAATAYYPGDNATWTAAVLQNYGGTITWKAR